MDSWTKPWAVSVQGIQAFRDPLCLRDPRGRSRHPSIVSVGNGTLDLRGPFTAIQRFSITPQEGRTFVETSRDANPIHTEDTVVSGAMTAARLLLLPEVLIPSLAVKSVRLKFRAFSRYDRPSVNRFTFRPVVEPNGLPGFHVDLAVFQQGAIVADGFLKAAAVPPGTVAGTVPASCAAAPCQSAETVRAWLESLRIRPDHAFGMMGYAYPRAFLASLPSGEMVRRGGLGGLLNVLDLEFPEVGVPSLEPAAPPTVEIAPSRPRNSFRRVLTTVASGMVTYCRGYATVLAAMLGGEKPSPAAV